METTIKAIENLIKMAEKLFEKAKSVDNYANMAVHEAYKDGLEMALEIVKINVEDEQ